MDADDRCNNCSVCDNEPFEVDTGNRSRGVRAIRDRLKRADQEVVRRRNRPYSETNHFTVREQALFDNLKMLRQLIASEKSVPAYTVFSDAALTDMVRKQPASMDQFLDVSGVGLTKQEQYGQVFLAVIRDAREPNDAMLDFRVVTRTKLSKENDGSAWSEKEEKQLREEYEAELPLREIAQKHLRSTGAIKARLQKMGLLE